MSAVSFADDVARLFTPGDTTCMGHRQVYLTSYDYMSDATADDIFADHANARHVLARIKGDELPQMPFHAPPWPPEKVAILSGWIDGGFLP
jgi:hypothetical protein